MTGGHLRLVQRPKPDAGHVLQGVRARLAGGSQGLGLALAFAPRLPDLAGVVRVDAGGSQRPGLVAPDAPGMEAGSSGPMRTRKKRQVLVGHGALVFSGPWWSLFWWSRRESNPRPQAIIGQFYMRSWLVWI